MNTNQRTFMRVSSLLLLALFGADVAAAQTPDCSRPNAPKASCPAPAAKDKQPQAKAAQDGKKSFVDPTLVDESALNTKIRSICRGC
jgi:hypothetical protein